MVMVPAIRVGQFTRQSPHPVQEDVASDRSPANPSTSLPSTPNPNCRLPTQRPQSASGQAWGAQRGGTPPSTAPRRPAPSGRGRAPLGSELGDWPRPRSWPRPSAPGSLPLSARTHTCSARRASRLEFCCVQRPGSGYGFAVPAFRARQGLGGGPPPPPPRSP